MNFIKTFFSREVLVYSKKSSNIISPIVFFLICITFFPLAVSNDPSQLSRFAPGIIWICILLSGMLSVQTIFKEDFEDGSLDLFYAKDFSILQIVLIKIIVNWLFSALPLIILSSSMVFLLYFPLSNLLNLLFFAHWHNNNLFLWRIGWRIVFRQKFNFSFSDYVASKPTGVDPRFQRFYLFK